MSAKNTKLEFITVTSFNESQKQKELRQARVRAHAAAITHRIKKKGRERTDSLESSVLASSNSSQKTSPAISFDHQRLVVSGETFRYVDRNPDPSLPHGLPDVAKILHFRGCNNQNAGTELMRLIDYTINEPTIDLTYAACNVKNLVGFALDTISDELLFSGLVSSVRLVYDMLHGRQPSTSALMYSGKVVKNLKKRITQPNPEKDDILLASMASLAEQYRGLGQSEVADLHWRTIAQLLATRGGFRTLPNGSVAKCILGLFNSIATIASGTAFFPTQRLTLPPVYPSQYQAELPPGFQALVKERKLSLEVLDLISRTYALRQQGRAKSEFRNRTTRKYDDLLEACPCLGWEHGLEKMICVAVMVYWAISMDSVPIPRILLFVSKMVLVKLLPLHQEASEAEKHCVIWIYAIALDAWRSHDNEKRLLDGLKSRTAGSVWEWERMEQILNSFFWTEALSKRVRNTWSQAFELTKPDSQGVLIRPRTRMDRVAESLSRTLAQDSRSKINSSSRNPAEVMWRQ